MSISPSNRESDTRSPGSNGNGYGKETNPDRTSSPVMTASGFQVADIASRREDRTDEQLLAGYRTGDRASFAELVNRYQRELFHFLVRFLGDRAAAEDVFQETFLQVHQSADQFDPERRFRPWLFTIAANKARDLMRSQARRPTNPLQASISPGDDDSGQFIDLMESGQAMPNEPLERQELQQQVHKAVMSMPEHLREILLLSYFHQFPYKQISDILQIPLGTVKSRLHAAVAHFADKWKATNQQMPLA
ncbi:MAG TPA: sigma-70 family RNA polymerase sigma factor [Tepidisphaeraceae bacterium]|jgi:RNA polymerase sigma-70 factor (ECF subfamily)|nr:sigma-70 family RNA polymerase sigma factor [Tepidisphaeraceae bacterium]